MVVAPVANQAATVAVAVVVAASPRAVVNPVGPPMGPAQAQAVVQVTDAVRPAKKPHPAVSSGCESPEGADSQFHIANGALLPAGRHFFLTAICTRNGEPSSDPLMSARGLCKREVRASPQTPNAPAHSHCIKMQQEQLGVAPCLWHGATPNGRRAYS